MDILLKNIQLIQEPTNPILEKVSIAVENGMISEISNSPSKRLLPDPDYLIEGKKLIALPPPINSHTHLPMTLLRGISDDKPLLEWLKDIWRVENKLTESLIELGTKLACLEMIQSGTGGVADNYFYQNIIGKVIHESGIRGWLGAALLPSKYVNQGGLEFQEEIFKKLLKLVKTSPLLTASIAPHSPFTVDEETILHAVELAIKEEIPIMIHASETREEVLKSEDKYGIPPIERLSRIGFFNEKPKAILAHCTWITQREVHILGENKVIIAWCPVSSQKLAYGGVTPVPELRSAGAYVSLGTDGTASNNTLDIWREMREATNVISADRWDPSIYSASNVLEDTCWTFRNVFKPNTFIKEGNVADISVLNFYTPHLIPVHNVISNIVYAANGSDCHSLIVNGQILMHNRQTLTLNQEKILEEVEERTSELN
ncbi:amidohydrolase [Candidatus Hodarchaeum mangrovi]